jgi:hypothetical protein
VNIKIAVLWDVTLCVWEALQPSSGTTYIITSQKISVAWNIASKRRLREKLLCCTDIHCYVSYGVCVPHQLQLDYEFLLIVRLKIYKWVEKYHNLPLHPCNSGADCVMTGLQSNSETAVNHTDRQHLWEASGSSRSAGIFRRSRSHLKILGPQRDDMKRVPYCGHTSIDPTIQKSVIWVTWRWGFVSPRLTWYKKLLKSSKLLSCLIKNVV